MAQNNQYTDLGVNQNIGGTNLQQGAYIQGDQGLGQGLIGQQGLIGGTGLQQGTYIQGDQGLSQGLIGQGLGQNYIGGQQGLQGGQYLDQGLLGQQGLGQNYIGGQGLQGGQYIDQGSLAQQAQNFIGGQQGLQGGQFINQGLIGSQGLGQNFIGGQQGLQGGILGHSQGVPGVGVGHSAEDYAKQSLLAGAGAHFHNNPGLLNSGVGTGGQGLISNVGLNNAGGLGSHNHGLGLGTGLATGAALGTGAAIAGHRHHHGGTAPIGTAGLTATGTGGTTAHGLTTGAGGAGGTIGRGTFTFRPIEGKFNKDKDIIGKMDPYLKIKIGHHKGKSSVAKKEGTNPTWEDIITIEKKHNEQFAKVVVKDHDKFTLNDRIGETKIPLADVVAHGKFNQWVPIYKKELLVGEILLDITFQPRETA